MVRAGTVPFAITVLLASACGLGKPAPVDVVMQNNAFLPTTIEVRAGGSVRFANKDGLPHTVTNSPTEAVPLKADLTYDLDAAEFNVMIAGGQKGELSFPRSGTYFFYCLPHNWMRGKVVVLP